MLAKLAINQGLLKNISEKKQRHLVTHLVTGTIHTNSLSQKGKKEKGCARNV